MIRPGKIMQIKTYSAYDAYPMYLINKMLKSLTIFDILSRLCVD